MNTAGEAREALLGASRREMGFDARCMDEVYMVWNYAWSGNIIKVQLYNVEYNAFVCTRRSQYYPVNMLDRVAIAGDSFPLRRSYIHNIST